MDKVLNAWIRELCGVKKGLDERTDEGLLWWFGHVERMLEESLSESVLVVVQWVGSGRDGLIS